MFRPIIIKNKIAVLLYHYLETFTQLSSVTWLFLFLNLINSITLTLTFFLSIYFTEILSFTMPQIGLLLSCYGIGMACGGVIGGKLADCYRPTGIMSASLITHSFVLLSLCYLTHYIILLLVLFIFGLSAYIFKTVNHYILIKLEENNPPKQFKIINLAHVASNLGLCFGGMILGFMTAADFMPLFIMTSMLCALIAIYLWQQKTEFVMIATATISKINERKANRFMLTILLLMVFMLSLLIAQLGTTYPIYIIKHFPTLGQKAVGILFTLDTVLIVLCQTALLQASKHINPFVIIGVGALSLGLGLAGLNIASEFYLAVLFGVIWTMGEMLFIPSIQLLCCYYGDQTKTGFTIGSFQSVFALSMIVGPALGSYLYAFDEGWLLWALSGCLGVTWCAISVYLARCINDTYWRSSQNSA